MNKRSLRKHLLEIAIHRNQQVLENVNNSINRIHTYSGVGSVNSATTIPAENPQRFLNILEEQYLFKSEELDLLMTLETLNNKEKLIGFGSVVGTTRGIYFISTDDDSYRINDVLINGITENNPIYYRMKGLKKGDSFQYRNMNYKITDVF